MRIIIQRVTSASVSINNNVFSSIGNGLLVLLGIEDSDTEEDLNWLAQKIVNLRIFNDENGVMNVSLLDAKKEILLVSQFTLFASTKKGNRPSYIDAAKPDISIPLYEKFVSSLNNEMNKEVKTGQFGADMQVSLINDGPVTIIIDSKNK